MTILPAKRQFCRFLAAFLPLAMLACGGGGGSDGQTDEAGANPAGNLPPVARAGADQRVAEGGNVTLISLSDDADGSIVTTRWDQISGPGVALQGQNQARLEFTAPQVAADTALVFRLRVTDNGGVSDTDDVTVTVLNIAPTVGADAQAVWNGPVGGATVEVFPYPTTDAPPIAVTTTSTSGGVEQVGTFDMPDGLLHDQLYLVRVTGGADYDLSRDGRVDDNPLPILDSFRIVLTGAEASRFFRVTKISEIITQRIGPLAAGRYPPADIRAEQDRRARWMLARDIDGDGDQDFNDILAHHPYAVEEFFIHRPGWGRTEAIYRSRISHGDHLDDSDYRIESGPGDDALATDGRRFASLERGVFANSAVLYTLGDPDEDFRGSRATLARHRFDEGVMLRDLDFAGNVLVVSNSSDVRLLDADNALAELGRIDAPDGGRFVIQDGLLYLATASGLRIFDIRDPRNPRALGVLDDIAGSMQIRGNRLFVSGRAVISEVDVSDPAAPRLVTQLPSPRQVGTDLLLAGNLLYDVGDRLMVMDVSTPGTLRLLTTERFRGERLLWRDNALFVLLSKTIMVLDVADPTAPEWVATLDVDSFASDQQDMVLSGDIIVTVAFARGQLIDLTNPRAPALVGQVLVNEPTRIISAGVLDVAAENGHAYVVVDGIGMSVIDVRNPAAPRLLGSAPGSQNSFCSEIVVAGQYAYLDCAGIDIIDVSNPAAPARTGFLREAGTLEGMTVDGDLLITGTADRLVVHDLRDNPGQPPLVGELSLPDVQFLRAMAVRDGRAHILDRGPEELITVAYDDPANPVITNRFDLPFTPGAIAAGDDVVAICHSAAPGFANGFSIIDARDDSTGEVLSSVRFLVGRCQHLTIEDDVVYASINSVRDSLMQVDISDPRRPVEIGFLDQRSEPLGSAVLDGHVYVASGNAGISVYRAVQRP